MKEYTVDDIMSLNPCYSREKITSLWAGRESLSLLAICQLKIDVSDIIWAVARLMTERAARLYACDCAEHILWIFERDCPGDKRPRECIEMTRTWVTNKTNDAASAAAWDAASAAAWAAARDAASAAARDAAWAAARAAERKWQLDCIIGYVTKETM